MIIYEQHKWNIKSRTTKNGNNFTWRTLSSIAVLPNSPFWIHSSGGDSEQSHVGTVVRWGTFHCAANMKQPPFNGSHLIRSSLKCGKDSNLHPCSYHHEQDYNKSICLKKNPAPTCDLFSQAFAGFDASEMSTQQSNFWPVKPPSQSGSHEESSTSDTGHVTRGRFNT